MLTKRFQTTGVLAVASVLVIGGALLIHGERAAANDHDHEHQHEHAAGPFADIERIVAVIHPTAGNQARGIVEIWQHGDHVHINGRVQGLEPNARHGFHIHEFGDCTAPDATSAGGHYNPEGHPHGLPNEGERHAGDLGNLQANDEGVAVVRMSVDNITVAGDHNPALGRGLIVHEGEDDGSQPVGDAGPRIGCGVFGVAQTE